MIFYKAIRLIGILGAAWIVYALGSVSIQLLQLSLALGLTVGDSLIRDQLLQVMLPMTLLAIALVVPYSRMNRAGLIICGTSLLVLGAYILREFFGDYFFSSRLVLSAIPTSVWINIVVIGFVILSQVGVIASRLCKRT